MLLVLLMVLFALVLRWCCRRRYRVVFVVDGLVVVGDGVVVCGVCVVLGVGVVGDGVGVVGVCVALLLQT